MTGLVGLALLLARALDICHCHPIEESAAPAPDVQEQPQHHLSSSWQPTRPFVEFTYKGARAAVPGRAFGARRLVEWRMRRACGLFEKAANAITSLARKKNFGESLVRWAATNILADLADYSSRN